MPTFTLPVSRIRFAISFTRRLRPSGNSSISYGAGHRVVEAFQKSKDRCGVRWSQRPLIMVPRHLRASSPLPQGFRPAQGPPFVITRRGLEFPGAEPHLRAVRSRRPTSVPSLDVTRIMLWVVSFFILSPFGPTAMLHTGPRRAPRGSGSRRRHRYCSIASWPHQEPKLRACGRGATRKGGVSTRRAPLESWSAPDARWPRSVNTYPLFFSRPYFSA